MIDGYADVAVVVSDAQKAKKWYVEKLGFKIVLDKDHVVAVSPNVPGNSLILHLCGDNYAPLEPGNTGIGLTANDFDRTCEELRANGVRFSMPPGNQGGVRMAKFLDLDGNEFWLMDSSSARRFVEEYAAT